MMPSALNIVTSVSVPNVTGVPKVTNVPNIPKMTKYDAENVANSYLVYQLVQCTNRCTKRHKYQNAQNVP